MNKKMNRDGNLSRNRMADRDRSAGGNGKSDKEVRPGRDGKSDREVRPGKDRKSDREVRPGRDGKSDRDKRPGRDGKSDREVRPGRDRKSDREVRPGRDGKSDREVRPGRDGKSGREVRPGRDGKSDRDVRLGGNRKADRNVSVYKSRNVNRSEGAGKAKNADKSENRIKQDLGNTICPASKKCGGCRYIGWPYEEQLRQKQRTVEQLLKMYGKVNKIIGMKEPEHYRNKVHAVFDFCKGKGIVSGIYQEGTHHVVPVDQCLLEDRKADEIIVSIRELAKSFKYKIYDEDSEYGLLRHVLIRVGHETGQIMVVLVLSSPILPSRKNFVNALCKLHPDITTIVLNVNNKKTSMVLGDKEQVLYGKGFIEDRLCGRTFRISPKSFYQVNAVQTEKLYGKAIEYAALTGSETVVDAYCGIGTIGLAAAEYAGKVIGVELNQAAVKDAVVNAKINGIKNADFYQNDAGKFMVQLAEAGEKIDVVFMDPPRSGSNEAFMDALLCLNPKRIVYISCNPETLARDLEYLTGKRNKDEVGNSAGNVGGSGREYYRVEEMTPVDMFPYTDSIETVCLLRISEK